MWPPANGLRRIAKTALVVAFKVGTSARGGIRARLAELGRERYAACWHDEGRYVQDSDFADWFPSLIDFNIAPNTHSPVRPTPRSIVVTLPSDMSPESSRRSCKPGWIAAPCING